jgi:hypothetical protein
LKFRVLHKQQLSIELPRRIHCLEIFITFTSGLFPKFSSLCCGIKTNGKNKRQRVDGLKIEF